MAMNPLQRWTQLLHAGVTDGSTMSVNDLQAWAKSDPGLQAILKRIHDDPSLMLWGQGDKLVADYQRAQGKYVKGFHIEPLSGNVVQDDDLSDFVAPALASTLGLTGLASAFAGGAASGGSGAAAGGANAGGGAAADTLPSTAFGSATPVGLPAGAPAADLAAGTTTAAGAGPAAALAGPAAASTPAWQTALKYGALPAIGGGLDAATSEHNAQVAADEKRYEANQATALGESKLDPYRGTMNQATDVAKLERGLQGPATYAPPASSPYAGAVAPPKRPALSSTYLTSLRNAQQGIASNDPSMRVPTMTNAANWGATGTTDLTNSAAAPPVAPGGTSLANSLLRRRRVKPMMPDPTDPNAWLTSIYGQA